MGSVSLTSMLGSHSLRFALPITEAQVRIRNSSDKPRGLVLLLGLCRPANPPLRIGGRLKCFFLAYVFPWPWNTRQVLDEGTLFYHGFLFGSVKG